MTLIDCFNTFQNVAKSLKLSANARSLYIAILGEFNSARYPDTLSITNRVLQDISGINAESSFHSARNALLNADLIRHKKHVYQLTPEAALEKLCRRRGATLETPWSQLGVGLEFSNTTTNPITIPKIEKEIEKDEEDAPAQNFSNLVSTEVLTAWKKYRGEKLDGGKIFGLHDCEKLRGTEDVIQAIKTASESNNYAEFPYITYNYFKRILENQQKGVIQSGRTASNSGNKASNAEPDWVDQCPN